MVGSPVDPVGLVRIKQVDGKEVRELMGVVMPLNLNINGEVNTILDRLGAAMKTQAELAVKEKRRKEIATDKARKKAEKDQEKAAVA